MNHPMIDLLYLVFALILGIMAFVLKKKHSQFPDVRVGYHHQLAMGSREKWEQANRLAGNLCAGFAGLTAIIGVILYGFKASVSVAVIAFLIDSMVAILTILIVPAKAVKR